MNQLVYIQYIYITSSYYFILLMHFFGIWPWIFATAKPWLQVQNLWERVISSRSSMIIPSLGSPSVRRSPQPKFLNFTMFHHFLNTSGTRGISGSWLFSFFFHETLCRDDTWWHACFRQFPSFAIIFSSLSIMFHHLFVATLIHIYSTMSFSPCSMVLRRKGPSIEPANLGKWS